MNDFDEIKARFQSRLGRTVRLGTVRNDQISVYYEKTWLGELGLSEVPLFKVEILNEKNNSGLIRIKFRYSRMVLSGVLLCLIVMGAVTYSGYELSVSDNIVSWVGLYSVLQWNFQLQARRFKKDFAEVLVDDFAELDF